jgi:hypothetical protein
MCSSTIPECPAPAAPELGPCGGDDLAEVVEKAREDLPQGEEMPEAWHPVMRR